MKSVFISYRRRDSGPNARHIAGELANRFGAKSVFIDTDSIRMGDNWGDRITAALSSASALVVIIGPDWLRTHDEDGRRRIDSEADWVRNEVLHGLSHNGLVIPVLVQGAKPFAKESLPAALAKLVDIQHYEISDGHWKRDIQALFQVLEGHGFAELKKHGSYVFPPKLDKSASLTELEIQQGLIELPDWKLVPLDEGRGNGTPEPRELHRHYVFHSFEDCLHFMMTASRTISKMQHHPRWENMWINLNVYITTWDIENFLSYRDIRLAKYLDELFASYKKR